MEYPELVFVTGDPGLVAHEVAHQWWYSIVGNDQYREPWLDETFASYSEQDLYGAFGRCSTRRPYDFLPSSFRPRRARLDGGMRYYGSRSAAYFGVVYDGGACALRSLEADLGRARMARLLRLLVSRHRHGVITREDALRAIADVAPPRFSLKRFRARSRL
jgi:aminopeptidase N